MVPSVIENLRTVSALWRDEWTGALVIAGPDLGREDTVELRDGGLVVATRARRLARAIAVGRVRFEARPVAGLGDRRILARVLMAVSRAVSVRVNMPLPNDALVDLAVPMDRLTGSISADLLDRLVGQSPLVGTLIGDGATTLVDLRALAWLGVLRVHRVRKPRAGPPPHGPQHSLQRDGSTRRLRPAASIAVPRAAPAPVITVQDVTADPTPRVDRRPIPMPALDFKDLDAGERLIQLAMRREWNSVNPAPRLAGVAFGQEAAAENRPAGLLDPDAQDTADITDETLLSGVEDELADVLSEEDNAVLLGVSGAKPRAVESAATAPVAPAPQPRPPPPVPTSAAGLAEGYRLGSFAAELLRRPHPCCAGAGGGQRSCRRQRRRRRR